jgi:hypothetical protein
MIFRLDETLGWLDLDFQMMGLDLVGKLRRKGKGSPSLQPNDGGEKHE